MIRVRIQLDDDVYKSLRESAHKQKKTISAVANEILRQRLIIPQRENVQIIEADLKEKYPWIGLGKSDETDMSVRHDDYLAED